MTNKLSAAEQKTLSEIQTDFDVQSLAEQLQYAVNSNDPVGYMENNINWEVGTIDGEEDESLAFIENFATETINMAMRRDMNIHLFRRFIRWFRRNKISSKVKRALCAIIDKIKELIDADAELKIIIEVALVALATAIGIAYINPVLLTIMVGILAMMILKGVDKVCGI